MSFKDSRWHWPYYAWAVCGPYDQVRFDENTGQFLMFYKREEARVASKVLLAELRKQWPKAKLKIVRVELT